MQWAKLCSKARFNLGSSGVMDFPLSELGAHIDDLEISGPSTYGFAPLQEAIAAKCGVPVSRVVAANGTSMANHIAMAALLEPGDEVLIEHPGYDLLVNLARYLGARVKRFKRLFQDGFNIDLAGLEQQVSQSTRLIVLTNLHNPSSVLLEEAHLRNIAEIAGKSSSRVLVDEVYLDAAFAPAPKSAFHLGEEFLTTNSLTKVYGLSGLRCGWILAQPELAERMWRLNDLFGVIPAHPAELLSCIAFRRLDGIRARSRALLENNRELLHSFLATRPDLCVVPAEHGTVAFPRLNSGNVDALCEVLRHDYETSVVPGRFFDMPQHFRIGIGCATEILSSGLERLATALDRKNTWQ